MKSFIQALIVIGCSVFCHHALAEEVRQLSWDDLIPAHLLSVDLLANLTEVQQDEVIWILTAAETLPEKGPDTEELYKDIDQARSDLAKAGIDIEKLMAKYKEIQTATVESFAMAYLALRIYLKGPRPVRIHYCWILERLATAIR